MTMCYALIRRVIPSVVILSLMMPSSSLALSPSQWPDTNQASPSIEAWPNGIRIAGGDRYQTSLASALVMRGEGGYPFATPDPSSEAAESLGSAAGWWGLGRCPRSVILVAGDSPADGLIAASLSDPTGRSSEPRLRRTASADPLFDAVGSYDRVDTYSAPIILTASSRSGAVRLSVAAKLALKDMRDGGCQVARDAIIVGGMKAVPVEVESELLSMGYRSVFRVAGADRYESAAMVAESLGTAPLPVGVSKCLDPISSDGVATSFYANSVIEFRENGEQCELLPRVAVLVDGVTGADALAASWWTGYWQVPVFFHNGSQILPDATAFALETMAVHNLVVLGGEERIPRSAVMEAVRLTGAATVRIEGQDRYATSVAMARYFGGWWPNGKAASSSGAAFCLAGSGGEGSQSLGWSDALVAGPFCGVATAQVGSPAPVRAIEPINGPFPQLSSPGSRSARDSVPILLVEPGSHTLPSTTRNFLKQIFPPEDKFCSSELNDGGCADPGFVIGFGGQQLIPGAVLAEASTIAAGRTFSSAGLTPLNHGAFATGLNMTPVFRQGNQAAVEICYPRNGYNGARWISTGISGSDHPQSSVDVMKDGWFRTDYDDKSRSLGVASPGCTGFDLYPGQDSIWSRTVGPDGRSRPKTNFSWGADQRTSLSEPLISTATSGSHHPSGVPNSSETSLINLSFVAEGPGSYLQTGNGDARVLQWNLYIEIEQALPLDTSPHTFQAEFAVATSDGLVRGTAEGEALYSHGLWLIRGKTTQSDNFGTRTGGFWMDLYSARISDIGVRAVWEFDLF